MTNKETHNKVKAVFNDGQPNPVDYLNIEKMATIIQAPTPEDATSRLFSLIANSKYFEDEYPLKNATKSKEYFDYLLMKDPELSVSLKVANELYNKSEITPEKLCWVYWREEQTDRIKAYRPEFNALFGELMQEQNYIFYLPPQDGEDINLKEIEKHPEVLIFTPANFEIAFNNGHISDEGYIKITLKK